jgi:hypothetical protein
MLYLNAQGIAGIGEITGRAYQVNDAEFKIPFNRVLLNGQGTVSSNIYLEVTNAPGPDGLTFTWWLDETVHVTFNADGTVTVNVDNFTADCGSCAGCWDYWEASKNSATSLAKQTGSHDAVIRVYDAAGNGPVGAIHDNSASREEKGTIERYGKRFVAHADEILIAFLELQRAIHEFAVSLIS